MLHSSVFWLVVSMAIFFAIVGKPAGRAVIKALDARRDRVRQELEEAERLRAEAQELLALCQRQQRDAMKEAEDIVADAKADAERLREQAASLLKTALAEREAAAMAKIAEAEANATREAREMATQIALSATRALLAERLKGSADEALVDSTIAHLPQKLAS